MALAIAGAGGQAEAGVNPIVSDCSSEDDPWAAGLGKSDGSRGTEFTSSDCPAVRVAAGHERGGAAAGLKTVSSAQGSPPGRPPLVA
eukprot:1304566-Pyramimonas_sp.AAC.1